MYNALLTNHIIMHHLPFKSQNLPNLSYSVGIIVRKKHPTFFIQHCNEHINLLGDYE